ncbi:MAG TPA: N-acetyl-D-Glu racemase DgcA [Pseudolabrys sp.]|nr:N-acetyl-D-Glu racemase DgcA [Pseudolabrys sp.]
MNSSKTLTLSATIEHWPIAGRFTISRGAKTEAIVVVATITDGVHRGHGECVPYQRYGESVEGVVRAIQEMTRALAQGLDRKGLQKAMSAGAARNAIDCAFWDFEAKRTGKPAHVLAGLPVPKPVVTAYTISLGDPATMAQAAEKASSRPLLKVKLGAEGDRARLAAVRAFAPKSRLIVDANEGWNDNNLAENLAVCARAGVEMVEQPLPAQRDQALASIKRPIPVCADESAHDRSSLPELAGKYDAVNIKLDKAGGLTEALAMAAEAEKQGFALMTGCMVATSLAMAPAVLLAQQAKYVDLDGPLLLQRDRPGGLRYDKNQVFPAPVELWG